MSKIQVLPPSVARRIAAGEVIDRPVSVVKELVENSLDARARSIAVELEQGGISLVAVADDGEGMSREEAPLALRPHATSKIRSEEDLLRVATLGFRGEALPSIAAVSDFALWTRRREDEVGTHLRVRGGELAGVEDAGTGAGCRIEVRDLFFNTPVRRKFLHSPAAEAGQVAQLLGRLSLAHPGVGFVLRQGSRETLALPPADSRRRIRAVLGAEVEAALRPVEARAAVSVEGFATHPHVSFANARSALFFVNRRMVRDRLLLHALSNAYASLIPHGRYPAAVLFVTLDPGEIDVNVHPTKLEIRFRNPAAVHHAIGEAVRAAFRSAARGADHGGVAESAEGYAARRADPRPTAETAPPRVPSLLAPSPSAPAGLFSPPRAFSALRVVGQVFDGYIVCEGEREIVLIDQHAAHERVAFERLRAARSEGRVECQPLLVAQAVELPPGEAETLCEGAETLRDLGLEIEAFGEGGIVVRAVPAVFAGTDVAPLVRALAADLADGAVPRALDERIDGVLATIACHSVVRVGQTLTAEEIRALLQAMDSVDVNTNCPHGRPVSVNLSRTELERRFGR